MPRRKIAVITARADDRVQKDIICGIAETAFSADADVVVFSNIYNHWVTDELLGFENIIYDFFDPDGFDGVIVTGEAFGELSVIEETINKIRKSKIPTVIINGEIGGFTSMYCDDENDMEQICEHLITVHGITDIDVLTGQQDNIFSQRRLRGCQRALEKHGLALEENKIYYGNFWYDSGYYLAQRYINRELPLPQAIVCTNDCMAYQLCDDLTSAGIRIPDDVVVTGYDCTGGRIYHHPFLTTYRSGRREIGVQAANYLLATDYEAEKSERFMAGGTCPCGTKPSKLNDEIKLEHLEHPGTFVSNIVQFSTAQFSQELTLSKTLLEYLKVISKYFFFHEANSLFFCLDKEWNSTEYSGEDYICCMIDGAENLREPLSVSKNTLLKSVTEMCQKPSVYYVCPLCFQTRLYGYTIFSYERPECFRYQIRDWNQIVTNALEFLRLKNDIHYLTLCQRTSSLYDALTGFCRIQEFRRLAAEKAVSGGSLIAIKIGFPSDKEYAYDSNLQNDIVSTAAMAIKQVCTDRELFGRTDDGIFLILCSELKSNLSERLKVIIYREIYAGYFKAPPIIAFDERSSCSAGDINSVLRAVEKAAAEAELQQQNNSVPAQYKSLAELRNNIISRPENAPDIDSASRKLCISKGYFRAIYRKCFGVSYVQDCINAKIMLAKYLLCTSVMSVYAVALRCGYTDEKYFARQFHQNVGCSPMQYRKKYCSSKAVG